MDAKGEEEEEDDVTLISGGKLSAAARKNKKESKGISEGEGGMKEGGKLKAEKTS